jgi:hydroxymethylbilane synthase
MTTFKLGTRGSRLALTQSDWVRRRVEEASGARVELEVIQTTGDRDQERPLPEIGGKGLFTMELDRALLAGEIDFAVHSLKDLPTQAEPGLTVVCVPEREDARDVLLGPRGEGVSLATLPEGAVLGTSSLRRQALARAFRPDLDVRDIRGNVDTRLRKLDEGRYDAVVMAAAGIRRMGLEARIGEWLESTAWLPAPGQGALGIVARDGTTSWGGLWRASGMTPPGKRSVPSGRSSPRSREAARFRSEPWGCRTRAGCGCGASWPAPTAGAWSEAT